jgi:hypothetical protein
MIFQEQAAKNEKALRGSAATADYIVDRQLRDEADAMAQWPSGTGPVAG